MSTERIGVQATLECALRQIEYLQAELSRLRAENEALKAELRNTQMHLRTAEERLAERTAELEAARKDSARLNHDIEQIVSTAIKKLDQMMDQMMEVKHG